MAEDGSSALSPSSVPLPQATPSTTTPQPALATTKRKFHRLLENLTKPASSKRSPDSISLTDSPAKRIRLEARSRLEAQARAHAAGSSPQPQTTSEEIRAQVEAQLLRTRLEAAKSTSSTARTGGVATLKEPNYVPWSHPAFLRRLQTFSSVRLWSSKPDAVNEVAWAKRGWTCVGLNTVACKGGCEERVVVGLRPSRKDEQGTDIDGTEDLSADISDELVARVAELIVNGHTEECLWRAEGCKDDIYRLPVTRQALWQPQLHDRYIKFVLRASSLPKSTDITAPADIPRLAKLLPPDFLSPEEIASHPQIDQPSLTFALLGWALSPDSTPSHPIATCDACFRRLGLWLYTQTSPPEEASADAPTALDLSTSHRSYCPWINPDSQHQSAGSLAGLNGIQVLVRGIENAAGFRAAGEGSSSRPASSASSAAPVSRPLTVAGAVHFGFASAASADANSVAGDAAAADDGHGADAIAEINGAAYAAKTKEELEEGDRARFAKLRELSRSIGLKGLRAKLGRAGYR